MELYCKIETSGCCSKTRRGAGCFYKDLFFQDKRCGCRDPDNTWPPAGKPRLRGRPDIHKRRWKAFFSATMTRSINLPKSSCLPSGSETVLIGSGAVQPARNITANKGSHRPALLIFQCFNIFKPSHFGVFDRFVDFFKN